MRLLLQIWKALHLPTNAQLFVMRRVNDQFLIGVTGVFLDEAKRILLVKHTYRDGDNWSLPGGYVKGKEHPKETLEREIQEETGYSVAVDARMKIRTDRDTARIDITYRGTIIGGVFTSSDEVGAAGLFAFDELPPLPKDQVLFIHRALQPHH